MKTLIFTSILIVFAGCSHSAFQASLKKAPEPIKLNPIQNHSKIPIIAMPPDGCLPY